MASNRVYRVTDLVGTSRVSWIVCPQRGRRAMLMAWAISFAPS